MGDSIMRVNIKWEKTELPAFRVMGMAIPISFSREAQDMALAWERWHSGSLKDALPVFSRSVYVLRAICITLRAIFC